MSELTRGRRGDRVVDFIGRLMVFGLVIVLIVMSYDSFPELGLAWAALALWALGLVADGAIAWLTGTRGMRLAKSVGATMLVWITLGATVGAVNVLGAVMVFDGTSLGGVLAPLALFTISVVMSSLLPRLQAAMVWAILGIGSAIVLDSSVVTTTDPGVVQMVLSYVLALGASGAFVTYLRRALRARLGWRALLTRLAWAGLAMVFSITIAIVSLGTVTTMLMDTQINQSSFARLGYVRGVAYDLGVRFPESDFASATPELTREIARAAGINDVGLTLWDLQTDRAVIAIRSVALPPGSEEGLLDTRGFRSVELKSAEKQAIARAARMALEGGTDPIVRAEDPVGAVIESGSWEPDTDPATETSSGPSYTIGLTKPSGTARFALVSTLAVADWQQYPGFTVNDVRQAVSAAMFPWLFLAFLLPCALALLALDRRDSARATLIAAEERARLNRDAHDRVYNRLTALANQLAAAEQPDATPPTPAEQIRRTVDDLQAILGDGVTAPYLSASLAAASLLADVCADQGRIWAMEVTLEGAELLEGIDPRVGWELQCIAEEALTNAGRHGHASHARVSLSAEEGLLRLEVADDGSGIAGPLGVDGLPAEASGMCGMLQRARALGGGLAVTTGAAGTTVSATIPHVSGS